MTTKKQMKATNAEAATAPKVSVSDTIAALEERIALLERCHYEELLDQRLRDSQRAADAERAQREREFYDSLASRRDALFDEFVAERLVLVSYQKCFTWAPGGAYNQFIDPKMDAMQKDGVTREERDGLRLQPDQVETRVGKFAGVSRTTAYNHVASKTPAFEGVGVKTEFRSPVDINADREKPGVECPTQQVVVL